MLATDVVTRFAAGDADAVRSVYREYSRLVEEFELLWDHSTQTDAESTVSPSSTQNSTGSLDEVE